MSPFALEQAFDQLTGVDDVPCHAADKQLDRLAAEIEELAALRFGIVLTARWESDPEEVPQYREELRAELADLRTRYYDKIDRLAMTYGVAATMKAKDDVERRVVLPYRAQHDELRSTAGND